MPLVLKVAVPVPIYLVFDYLPPAGVDPARLKPGVRVAAPFGRHGKTGILLGVAEDSDVPTERLRQASAILDEQPLLAAADLQLISWASHYYHYPIGEAMSAALAPLLRKGGSTAPKPERRLFAVAASEPALLPSGTLRAPRQAALLARLQAAPAGLTPAELAAGGGGFAATARALTGKCLAVWRETLAVPALPPPAATTGTVPALNPDQDAAVTAVTDALGAYRAFLLDGVTGSGKTEVYLRLTQAVLARGQQVMILLPEINLTPQLEARFQARFPAPIAVFHSALTHDERRRSWLAMQRGEAAILLGTRSAAFTPAPALGLIILDEEHDSSFKQQEGWRFSARDVAVKRASLAGAPVLLGSATPSLESLHNAASGRYTRLSLPTRAGAAAEPRFEVLDIRAQWLDEGLSAQLASRIGATLARGEQTLLFVNRRGFAPTLICHDCGWVAPCPGCAARLVIHSQEQRLRCHHCGREQPLPRRCPVCGKAALRPLGLGTERVEAALRERFPGACVARIDRDSTRRKGELKRLLKDIQDGVINILIGTQMLAKGHHFPGVTLAGLLDVDAGLYSTDFRAGERTAQIIMQVAGRAGREDKPGTVILQTRHPGHPLLQALVQRGYPAFARAALLERRAAGLPPYAYQALWRADAPASETAQQFLQALARQAGQLDAPGVLVLGPVPAPLSRRDNRYRWQLLMQAERRSALHGLLDRLLDRLPELDSARKVRWSMDVDPVDLF